MCLIWISPFGFLFQWKTLRLQGNNKCNKQLKGTLKDYEKSAKTKDLYSLESR